MIVLGGICTNVFKFFSERNTSIYKDSIFLSLGKFKHQNKNSRKAIYSEELLERVRVSVSFNMFPLTK